MGHRRGRGNSAAAGDGARSCTKSREGCVATAICSALHDQHPHSIRSQPHGVPSYRRCPHRSLQLGPHSPPRRRIRAPNRGHRPRALDPRIRAGRPRGSALAGHRLGRGTAPPDRRAERHAEVVEPLSKRARLSLRLHAGGARSATGSRHRRRRQGHLRRHCRDLDLGDDCGTHTVRLRIDRDSSLRWDDLVFGPSGQDASEIGDGIIRRSDGTPLYHLAVVVDDLDMGITHVVRGADHHSNTPFQLAIYRALDADPPIFAHVPLIVAESGRKLSKRKDPVSIQQFKADGYLPEAMLNWLARLGWSHGDQESLLPRRDRRVTSTSTHVGRSGAQADLSQARMAQPALHQRTAPAKLSSRR